ncbi:MAG: tryptophan--tRNA ligase, partial [Oscillospiraceae bacterium]
KKFKSAITDSDACVRYADGKDGVNNLMGIYSCCTGLDFDAIEKEFAGRGYGDFKVAVAQSVIAELAPVQEKYAQLMKDKAYLSDCAKRGAEQASEIAGRTLSKVMKKVGFYQG